MGVVGDQQAKESFSGVSESLGLEWTYYLTINGADKLVVDDSGVDLIPVFGFECIGQTDTFTRNEGFLLFGKAAVITSVSYGEIHLASFLISDWDFPGSNGDLEQVAGVDGL